MHHKRQSHDVWFLRYQAWWTYFFVIFDNFLPFYLPNNPKNQNFDKMKKTPGDIILQMCTINGSHMIYGSWDMECNGRIFIILDQFLPFYPLVDPESQNFEKMKNIPRDIIILHICTINGNHMMYGSWDIKHDGHIFLSFWTIFLLFYLPNNPKNQNFDKMKKMPGDIIILQMCTIYGSHMMYSILRYGVQWTDFLSFWTSFCPFTALSTQRVKILKKWKTHLKILSFYTCVP